MRMFFKCHRTPDGKLTDWYVVDKIPNTWPEGSKANFYLNSENIMYLVPDDSVRYYKLEDGALCCHCSKPIDKACMLYAEHQEEPSKYLCSKCWGGINHGEIDLPTVQNGRPIYRLRNSPIYGD